jgi:hypothetical protein
MPENQKRLSSEVALASFATWTVQTKVEESRNKLQFLKKYTDLVVTKISEVQRSDNEFFY